MEVHKEPFSQSKEWFMKALVLGNKCRSGNSTGWDIMKFAKEYHIHRISLTQEGYPKPSN